MASEKLRCGDQLRDAPIDLKVEEDLGRAPARGILGDVFRDDMGNSGMTSTFNL